MATPNLTSSPLSSAPQSQTPARPGSSQPSEVHRTTRQLPFELAQHVRVYFEESMFTQACRLLMSIASSDVAVPGQPITIPPPNYLALLATLTVHPALTTRTSQNERLQQSVEASKYLRLLLRTSGPVNSMFKQAFTFLKYDLRAPHRDPDGDEEGSDTQLNTAYAEADSMWTRAEDFWAVVGWAFNCSCLKGMHESRWQRWMLWLDFMVDVLEVDWKLHCSQETNEETLIWQYIELAPGGNARARRMLRAIFADGTHNSLNEFREVFRRELKDPPRNRDQVKKREVDVDIDAEIFGDYLNKDSDESSDSDAAIPLTTISSSTRPSKRMRTRTPSRRTSNQSLRSEYESPIDDNSSFSTSTMSTSVLGSPHSVRLRLRLLNLLAQVAHKESLTLSSPTTFPSADELYTLYTEFIKPLPIPILQSLVSPSLYPSTILDPKTQTIIVEFILYRLLESNPSPSSFDEPPRPTQADTISTGTANVMFDHLPRSMIQKHALQTEYLPFAANKHTVEANARVSILLESLLRHFYLFHHSLDAASTQDHQQTQRISSRGQGHLDETVISGLDNAVERGIRRRFEVCGARHKDTRADRSRDYKHRAGRAAFNGGGGNGGAASQKDAKGRKSRAMDEEQGMELLRESAQRMRLVMRRFKGETGINPFEIMSGNHDSGVDHGEDENGIDSDNNGSDSDDDDGDDDDDDDDDDTDDNEDES